MSVWRKILSKLLAIEVTPPEATIPVKFDDTRLIEAICQSDAQKVAQCLGEGYPVQTHLNTINRTPLILAAQYKNEEIVRLLLNRGADINAATPFGETALIIAAMMKNARVFRVLLERGADIYRTTRNGNSAIKWAIKNEDEAILAALREYGVASLPPPKQADTPSETYSADNSMPPLPEHWKAIPWRTLEHAYGEASGVPENIWELTSLEAEARAKARNRLYGNIFHQGSRYQATSYAVPLLFEILMNTETPEREEILSLLVCLAVGYAEEYLPSGIDLDSAFGTGEEREGNEAYPSYLAVERYASELISLTQDENREVRLTATYMLAWFPRKAELFLPIAREISNNDERPLEQANALLTLGLLSGYLKSSEYRSLFEEKLAETNSAIVQLAAAIALVTTEATGFSPEALGALLRHMQAGDEIEETLSWNEGDLTGYAGIALESVLEGNEAQIAATLCEVLTPVPVMRCLSFTNVLLYAAFPNGASDLKNMTDLQRRALEAIAERGAWQVLDMNWVDYSALIRSYGLPSTVSELQILLHSEG